MRDIIRDAAVITMAHMAMTDDAWMSVKTFIETYAGKAESFQEELRATLSLYNLIWEEYKKAPWENEGTYIWRWSNEKA